MSAHPAVRPSVGPFVRWPARLCRRSSLPPLRSDTPASRRCGRMHRPPHRIPSAVSVAPRRIDAPFIPAPRPPHCVSSAASAALRPGRCVRCAPFASTLRSFPRPVRRIVSLPLRPLHCLPAAAPRLPPANPARMRRAAGSGASAGTFGLFGLPASSPALRLSGSSAAAAPCPSHVLAPMPPPDGRRGPPGIKNKY